MAAGVLDAETERAARAFLARLDGRYAVREAIVFGSRARGDFGPESDADLAVVLRGPKARRFPAVIDMAGTAFDILLETGILVEALPLWEEEIDKPDDFSNPDLIWNIQSEGIKL